MALDTSQQNKFNQWMNSKGAHPTCPVCSRAQWSLGEIIAGNTVVGGGVSIGGNQTIPMVQLICNNCAYVMLFAAVPIGLTS